MRVSVIFLKVFLIIEILILEGIENKTDRISSRLEKSANTFNDDIFKDIHKLINQSKRFSLIISEESKHKILKTENEDLDSCISCKFYINFLTENSSLYFEI